MFTFYKSDKRDFEILYRSDTDYDLGRCSNERL